MLNNSADCGWALSYMDGSLKCALLGPDEPVDCVGVATACVIADYSGYDPELPMNISELYPAISGEGGTVGTVCTIVRTVGCNLRCKYCDTVYAYDGGDSVPTKDVVEAIQKYGIGTVLFTGGEPLLDQKVASNFLQAMFAHEIKVIVETNGAVDIRPFVLLARMVMDVKCPSSGMHDKMLWLNVDYLGFGDEIKFVVADRTDYEYACGVIEKYSLSKRAPNVFISPAWPKGSEGTFFQEVSTWMIADKSPARLSLQQHKFIWGAKTRGV